jgi:hypothetical protein
MLHGCTNGLRGLRGELGLAVDADFHWVFLSG